MTTARTVFESQSQSPSVMLRQCVVQWLKELRYAVETYDEMSAGVRESEVEEEDDGSYDLDVKFGKVCRVSVAFCDGAEKLRVAPVIYHCADCDLPEDVKMWKGALRYSYCAEEEYFFEGEDLINDCQNVSGQNEDLSRPAHFPLDEENEVQIRTSIRNPVKVERPKTYANPEPKKHEILNLENEKFTKLSAIEKVKTTPWWQLRKLLKKRASKEILESRGILKNEPVFGNTLSELASEDNPVPQVVTRIVAMIEEENNIKSLGLYRASANLATVQNIRCEINAGRWEILQKYKNEVDVLAGTLKLFFRELKEPLIPFDIYKKWNETIMNKSENEEINTVIEELPRANKETLIFIIRHLLKVCQYQKFNKMDLYNISVCWSPSLLNLPDTCTDIVVQTAEFRKFVHELLLYYQDKLDVPHKSPDSPYSTIRNVEHQKSAEQDQIDFDYELVRIVTEMIESRIETEGIYRKSGSSFKIQKIMKIFEERSLNDINKFRDDIHELCCSLKKYIAAKRKIIAPDNFFQDYYEICDNLNDNSLEERVRDLVDGLPYKNVIYLLFRHLKKVILYEKKNKMSCTTLGELWMTTLTSDQTIQNYKEKKPKYLSLFTILLNLSQSSLPDLVVEPKVRSSKYDNVPDDIHEDETSSSKFSTKL